MDDRTMQAPTESPMPRPHDAPGDGGRPLDDPRALTILTTEHWSLLSARSLVYNEAFARAGMFLTFLSATLVALGLVSAGTGFSRQFLVVAAIVLALDLFVGFATLGRVASATGEDIRYLQGMNRLRHAYHETVPGLEKYFVTGRHDDIAGVFSLYGATESIRSRAGVLHGLTTTPGMLFVICAAVAGALVATVILLVTDSTVAAAACGVITLAGGGGASILLMHRRIARFAASMESVFPSPQAHAATSRPAPEKATMEDDGAVGAS